MMPDDAAAEDTVTFPGSTPGTPPSSTPRPPWAFCSAVAPAWIDSRPATSVIGASKGSPPRRPYRPIGDRGDAGSEQALGLVRIGRKMQISEEQMVVAQLHPFVGLRLLDLHDHVGLREHVGRSSAILAPAGTVGVVVSADAGAGARLDQNLMAVGAISAMRWRTRYSRLLISLGQPIRILWFPPPGPFRALFPCIWGIKTENG